MNYLAIIRKADFVDLFKFGKLNVYWAINFDGNIKNIANDNNLLDNLTKNMNLFEYSFEYLVIHFNSNNDNESIYSVSIENVIGLYTFDEEARKEMSVSFDPRIKLHVLPFSEKLKALYNNRLISQSKRGIDNLWKIFNLSKEERDKCESIINDDIISEIFDGLFSYKRPTGKQSIWTYLLRYERHNSYPKDTKGFFYDYIHIACNWMKKEELIGEVVTETELFNHIEKSLDTDLEYLLNIVENSKLPGLTDCEAECNFAIASILFLQMKHIFTHGFYYIDSEANYYKKFNFEFAVAVYLLGLYLGYDKTYDEYYNFVELPIFELRDESHKSNKFDYEQEPNVKEMYSENRNENAESNDISTNTNSSKIEQKISPDQEHRQGEIFNDTEYCLRIEHWLRIKHNGKDNEIVLARNYEQVDYLKKNMVVKS